MNVQLPANAREGKFRKFPLSLLMVFSGKNKTYFASGEWGQTRLLAHGASVKFRWAKQALSAQAFDHSTALGPFIITNVP